MEGWKKEESYTDAEWDRAADILNRHMARDMRPEGVLEAMEEMLEELGRVCIQNVEGMLELYGWPIAMFALPKHCVPNDMYVAIPGRPDKEADYWVLMTKFDPSSATRVETIEEIMGCSYEENLEHLKKAGGAFPAPGRINLFSEN